METFDKEHIYSMLYAFMFSDILLAEKFSHLLIRPRITLFMASGIRGRGPAICHLHFADDPFISIGPYLVEAYNVLKFCGVKILGCKRELEIEDLMGENTIL